ncbi:hypothetical protein T01_6729 [Trichinella spiralis]|uniref:Uncharacterized protein n=1 Tax=Trichinella spiralis TaxID=6334 RepID=A0A0V1B241_TRISP|nr:hypothetical protein T01_6729 [Trichinella spiralis]
MEMLEMLFTCKKEIRRLHIFNGGFGIEKWQIFGERALPNSSCCTSFTLDFVEPQAQPASLLGSLNRQLDVPIDH